MTVITLLRIGIELLDPFAVAAPEVAVGTDRPIAIDPSGAVVVPTSSLAGSLRSHLRGLGLDEQLMGGAGGDRSGARSSRLRLLGSRVEQDGGPLQRSEVEDRTQTAMDRRRGGALESTLRSSEVGPPGATVELFARVDGTLGRDELDAIVSWRPWVGGGRSHGMGGAVLRSVRVGTLDLSTRDGLTMWLRHGGPELVARVAVTEVDVPEVAPAEVLRVTFRIVDGLMTAGERVGNVHRIYRRYGQPVIEGSALKGVLRARCEWILGSLGYTTCAEGARVCGRCPTCSLFGSVEQRARVRVWLSPIRGADVRTRDHVAIDRISGGASAQRLFGEEVVVAGTLDLVIDALGPLAEWERLLLCWAVRDIHDGYVGLGSRTTRGFGTVELTDLSVLGDLPPLAPVLEEAGL